MNFQKQYRKLEMWIREPVAFVSQFSYRRMGSDLDLAAMVEDFLEIGSAGTDSWYSPDSDAGFSDLLYHADRISACLESSDEYQSELMTIIRPHILSISDTMQFENRDSNCILYSLVKTLQSSGYDAALCISKWQGVGKFPGGQHEYIDVLAHQGDGAPEKYIIEIDFRCHFQIARAVKPYNRVLDSLPTIFVGKMAKLKQLLQIMVDAVTYSLEQNSMPLPPWRSLNYLAAKWETPCKKNIIS